MKAKYDVLVVGDYSIDLIFAGLPGLPELGKEVIGSGFAMLPGESYNSAIAMHRLGIKVGWAADFGNDELSIAALKQVQAEGLDDKLIVRHKRSYRRITVAASFPEDRAFITYYDPEPKIPAGLKALFCVSSRFLFIPGFYTGPLMAIGSLLVKARRIGLIMDGNSHNELTLDASAVRNALKRVDIFLPNALEARRLTGAHDLEKAARILAGYCPLIVVKDGSNGAYACSEGNVLYAPALPLTPVDTTGAGDCFNAGFIKAYLDKKPLEQCLRWGNVVGGLSTLELGGTGRCITPKDVEAWLE